MQPPSCPPARRRPPALPRLLGVLLAAALTVSACGSDETDASPPETETLDATTTEAPQESTETEASTTTEATPDATEGAEPEPTPVEITGIASALPIAETFEMPNPIFGTAGGPGGFAATAGGTLVVLNADGVTTVPLTTGALQFDTAVVMMTDRHAIVHGFEYGWGANSGGVNAAISIDLTTYDVATRSEDPNVSIAPFSRTADGDRIQGRIGDETGLLNAVTLELEPGTGVLDGSADREKDTYRIGEELWLLSGDGTIEVRDIIGGGPLREGSLGREVGSFLGRFMGSSAKRIWVSSPLDSEVAVLDRETLEVLEWIDIGAAYPTADTVDIAQTLDNLLLLDVVTPDGSWYVLAELDVTTGEIVNDHVVAASSSELWPTALDRPSFGWSGDDLYVQDHLRRVVRVDLDRWGTATEGDWSDPGLSIVPDFAGEDAEVAELAVRWINGEANEHPRTDQALTDAFIADTAGFTAGDVSAYTVDVHGDRAFVGLSSSIFGVTPMLAMERIDGGWAVNSISECWLVNLVFPQNCPAYDG